MENWAYEFNKLIQQAAKSPSTGGFFIGKVIKSLPDIVVSLDNDILLDREDLVIANQLYIKHAHQADATDNKPLLIGDDVILIADSTGQRFVLIDKVGE